MRTLGGRLAAALAAAALATLVLGPGNAPGVGAAGNLPPAPAPLPGVRIPVAPVVPGVPSPHLGPAPPGGVKGIPGGGLPAGGGLPSPGAALWASPASAAGALPSAAGSLSGSPSSTSSAGSPSDPPASPSGASGQDPAAAVQAHRQARRQAEIRSRRWQSAVIEATRQLGGLDSRYAAAAARAGGGSGRFQWPEASTVLTQGFGCTPLLGEPYDPACATRHMHTGVDIAGPDRTPIFAADTGVVTTYIDDTGYGRHVIVVDGHGYETLYGHLSRFVVTTGQMVHNGQLIGFEGATGYATGPHLHFEIRWHGRPVDPCSYFDGCSAMTREFSWQSD
ncbi:MAG: M23 family metallopeptidase [Candidatus Dormibacteraceae bacterium]